MHRFNLAVELARAGRPADARRVLRVAFELDPKLRAPALDEDEGLRSESCDAMLVPMKRSAFILLMFAVLQSGAACYGNTFLDGMVGRWSVTVTVVFTQRREVLARETTTRETLVTKLSDGTYHSVVFGDGQTKLGEAWLYKNGKRDSIYYTEEGLYNGEGKGTWRVRSGKVITTETAKTLDIDKMVLRAFTRRLDADTYAGSGTGTVNRSIRVTSTLTSVRLQ